MDRGVRGVLVPDGQGQLRRGRDRGDVHQDEHVLVYGCSYSVIGAPHPVTHGSVFDLLDSYNSTL